MRRLLLLSLVFVLIPAAGAAALGPTPVSITLGAPQQLFHVNKPDALGMKGVPDQPLTPILQPDKSYHLFIVGGEIGGVLGSTGLISTRDFLTYAPVGDDPVAAQTVLPPSCRGPERGTP